MPDVPEGAGFVIPASVQLDLADPNEFLRQIRTLVDQIQALAKTGAKPIDPLTGRDMGIDDIRKNVGRMLNEMRSARDILKDAFGGASAEVKALDKEINRVLRSTAKMRTPEGVSRPLPPIYDVGPRPTKRAFQQGVREAGDALWGSEDAKRAAASTKRTAAATAKAAAGIEEAQDPIEKMVKGFRASADRSRRIAANEQKVLDEQARAEVTAATARRKYAEKFDTDTRVGKARTTELASANVAEERRRLQQRNMEIALTRLGGGEKLMGANRYVEEGLARAVRIEQRKLELAGGSAKSMAEEKILRDRLNRAVEGQVRAQTTAADRAQIAKDKAAQRRADVRQEQAELRAITPTDRYHEGVLKRQQRLGEARQKLADLEAMQVERDARGNLIGRGAQTLRAEARAKADQAVQDAQRRQYELKQFDTSTKRGRERTGELALTAVREREQQIAQRAAEIDLTRQRGGVAGEAAGRVREANIAREISIEQTKIDLAEGNAKKMAEEKVQRDQLNREIAAEVRAQQDVQAIAKETLDKQRERLGLRAATRAQETPADLQQIATDKLEEEARQREIERLRRAGVDRQAIAQDNAARARDRVAQEIEDRRAITPEDRQQRAVNTVEARLEAAQQRLAENAEMRSATGRQVLQAEAELAAGTQELKAERARLASTDMKLIAATAAEANAREEQAARVSLLRAGTAAGEVEGLGREELLARAAVMKRTQADLHQTEVIRQTTDADVEAAAQRKLAEAKLRVALGERERQIFREASKGSDASLFQRLQSALSPRSGKLPEEQLNFKQFLGDKFQRTFGYAVSGAALGLGVSAIGEMFKDAMELEQTFVRLRGQMEGIGRSDAFPAIRDQIRDIAATTGQASNEVGALYSRFLGLKGDPAQAIRDTAEASKLMTVTGLDQQTMLQSLIPVQKSFGVTAEEVGDQVVAAGEKFGLAEDQLTEFLGKTSVTAKNAGLSLNELVAIGANMANSLGKPISSSAEAINKSFSLIEKNAFKIFDVLRANPATQGAIKQMSDALGAGQSGRALIELLKASRDFTAGQRQTLLTSVVSRRESEEFNALFSNAEATIRDLEQGSGDTAGRLNSRFQDLKDTVAVTFQSIRANFEAMGDLLFKAGVADWLRDVGAALGLVVGGVNVLIGTLAKLNEIPVLGGLVTTVGRLSVTTFALVKLYQLLGNTLNWATGATKEETAAETENAGSKGRTAIANQEAILSERELAVARQGATTTTKTQTSAGGVPHTWTRGRGYTSAAQTESMAEGTAVGETAAVGTAAQFRVYRDNLKERVAQSRAIRESTRAELASTQAVRSATREAEKQALAQAREAAKRPFGERLSNWMLTPWGDQSGRLRQTLPSGPTPWERLRTRYRDFTADRAGLYESRRNIYAQQYAQQAAAGTLQNAGFLQRALAGGRFLQAPAADAHLAATGQAAFGSSALIVGAIALAGAAAVKNAYDDQKQKVQADAEGLKAQLRQMNVQQLKQIGEYRTSLIEQVAYTAFGVQAPGEMITQERRFAETSDARRAIGAYVRPQTPPLQKAATEIAGKQESVDKQIAGRLRPENREAIIKKLMESVEGRTKLQQLGILAWAQGVDASNDRVDGLFGWQIKNDADSFSKLVNYTRTAPEGERESTLVSDASAGIFDALRSQGNATDLIGRAANLSDAADAVAKLQEGNKSVDQVFVDMGNNLAENADNGLKTIDELSKEFEGGQLSQGEYLNELRRRLPDIKRVAAESPTSEFGKQAKALGIEIETQINRVATTSLENYDNLITQLRSLGSLTPKKVIAEGHAARIGRLDEQTQFKELPQLMEEEISAQEEALSNIYDPQARLDAMSKGVKFSKQTREVFLKRGIQESEKAVNQIKKLAAITGQDPAELRKKLTSQAAEEGKSLEQVATEWIDKQIEFYGEAKKHGNLQSAAEATNKFNELTAARSDFVGAFSGLPDIPDEAPSASKQALDKINVNASVRQADRAVQAAYLAGDSVATAMLNAAEARDAYNDMVKRAAIEGSGVKYEDVRKAEAESIKSSRQAADAQFNYAQRVRNRAVIAANGDPVKENAARMVQAREALAYARRQGNKDDAEAAEQQIMELEQQAAENALNIQRGRMQATMALVQEDPFQLALKQLQAAEFELANAKGDADRGAKEAAVTTAQQNLNNSISNSLAADAQLAMTLANLRGDTVGAAVVAANEAKRRLDEAVAKGITDRAVLAPLEASLAEANKQLFLAPIQKQIDDLDYLRGLEQISLGQYIAGLESLLGNYDVDSKEYRELRLKIFNLKKEAGADLQFNLPSQIQLPTLYEARRLNQSRVMGIGYMDARNITMTFNVSGAQDPAVVTQQIATAMKGALGGSQIYTPGVTVGSVN